MTIATGLAPVGQLGENDAVPATRDAIADRLEGAPSPDAVDCADPLDMLELHDSMFSGGVTVKL